MTLTEDLQMFSIAGISRYALYNVCVVCVCVLCVCVCVCVCVCM